MRQRDGGTEVGADEAASLRSEVLALREQQAGASEILRIINASPGNLAPVFDAMLSRATHLCNAHLGILWTYDGEAFTIEAERGEPSPRAVFGTEPMRASQAMGLGRVACEKRVVHIHDIPADLHGAGDPVRVRTVEQLRARTWLGVPLLKDGNVLGVFTIYRNEVRPFSHTDIALLTGFAEQAVIAIENTRLFGEVQARTEELEARTAELEARTKQLSDALQQQTATADVLQIISQSTFDLQAILDTLTESAARLCEADMAGITREKECDGGYYYVTS